MSRFSVASSSGEGATIRQTIIPGDIRGEGYRCLEAGPGEPLQARNDFGGSGGSMRLRSLACFVQVSDLHVADVQSPARAEFLDRLGDPDSPYASTVGKNRTYRAQEPFGHQVIEAMSIAIRRLGGGPLTGAEVSFAVSTGDATDNCQGNELENYIALLDGGRLVRPDSGDFGRFDGVGAPGDYDVRYWHPDGTPDGALDDLPRLLHGFPTIPGILDSCREPFFATGLGVPWYAVYGNHDALVGGIYPQSDALRSLVIGTEKPTYLDVSIDVSEFLDRTEVGRRFGDLTSFPIKSRTIDADAARQFVGTEEWIAAHLQGDGRPFGHGFDEQCVNEARAYYGFDVGEIRFLVLDTVNRFGGYQGSIDDEQFRWLESELIGGDDRLFVLFSHHTVADLTNCYDPQNRVRHGSLEVVELLTRFANVVCWFNGHTHENAVHPIRSKDSSRRGFWEVTSASHIDWPQQSRLIEIALDESSGDLAIATVCIDHAGVIDARDFDVKDPLAIAGWSREIAFNAWQARASLIEPLGRGKALDRNVALMMPAPFPIVSRP